MSIGPMSSCTLANVRETTEISVISATKTWTLTDGYDSAILDCPDVRVDSVLPSRIMCVASAFAKPSAMERPIP